MNVVAWLGTAEPVRGTRWLDGTLAAARAIGSATAVAAGDPAWLELVCARAAHHGVACTAIACDLVLDYLGWAQVAAAAARELDARLVLVDEASRPERAAEVAAIAELLDAAQLGRTIELASASDGDAVRAIRIAGHTRQTLRVTGRAVIGVRISAPPVTAAAASAPSPRRCDLAALALELSALQRHATPRRTTAPPVQTIERVIEYLAAHKGTGR